MTIDTVNLKQRNDPPGHDRKRILLELVVSGALGFLVGYRDVLAQQIGVVDSIFGANFGLVGNTVPWAAAALILGIAFPSGAFRNAICLVATPAIVSQTIAIWKHGIYNLLPFALFLFVVYMTIAVITAVIGAAVRRNIDT